MPSLYREQHVIIKTYNPIQLREVLIHKRGGYGR